MDMTNAYNIELTDTFAGEANYSWVKRAKVYVPELTHYGYDGGTNYARANKIYNRELMRKAKAAMGLTNVRGVTSHYGDTIEFRPYGDCVVLFVSYCDGE